MWGAVAVARIVVADRASEIAQAYSHRMIRNHPDGGLDDLHAGYGSLVFFKALVSVILFGLIYSDISCPAIFANNAFGDLLIRINPEIVINEILIGENKYAFRRKCTY